MPTARTWPVCFRGANPRYATRTWACSARSGTHASTKICLIRREEQMSWEKCRDAQSKSVAQEGQEKVLISVMTPHQFVGGFKGNISGCTWQGRPLGCEYVVPKRNPELHLQSGAENLTSGPVCHRMEALNLQFNSPSTHLSLYVTSFCDRIGSGD